jgi:hypothetical protein
MHSISRNKFEVLAGMTRDPGLMLLTEELEHYSDVNEHYLGVILRDRADDDFSAIILARDEFGKFCCIDLRVSMANVDDARAWLESVMKSNSVSGVSVHSQGHKSKPTLDLFAPIVPKEKQHIYFQRLHSDPAFKGARKVISEMMPHFVDVDGNFVQQFQSDGFDARVWELYLFAVLKESGIELDRAFHAPDYVGSRFGSPIALEAVIVGRKPEDSVPQLRRVPKMLSSKEVWDRVKDEMPIRFGSPLYSKLKKKYWELEHVRGKPLVLAIADFHDDQSMIWSHSALYPYLYGKRFEVSKDKASGPHVKCIEIGSHTHEGKTIPSGFFRQDDSSNISAVITSASGTLSKFNRMGRQAGYGDPSIKVIRAGYCHNDDPQALAPKNFAYRVDEQSTEIWSEGLNVFHNPNANWPLNPKLLPFAGHHFLEEDKIVSLLPKFHPFASWTINLIPK